MKYLTTVLLMISGSLLFAQSEKKDIHKGNQLYMEHKYKEAEERYRRSVQKKEQSTEGTFNLGDALYKQKKFTQAGQQFEAISKMAAPKGIKARAYHNLGNSLLQSKKIQESIEAYKQALINNPKDDQTRYNLAYAQQLLKKQQQNQRNPTNNSQNNQNQNKQNQDKKQQDKDQKDKQNKDQKPNNKDRQKENEPSNRVSKEDAERMLNALSNEEQNTQNKLKNRRTNAAKGGVIKDW